MEDKIIEEFREYFNKYLKPRKLGVENLVREILVDFLRENLSQARQSTLEEIDSQIVYRAFPERESDEYEAGYNDCIMKVREIITKMK